MQYALINEVKSSAKPHLKGLCTCCLQPVIAKCGTQKIWHWSHLKKKNCDVWWETETEWSRNWKSKFPIDQQEVILENYYEKHLADVKTADWTVIEFQNSSISNDTIKVRENFIGI